MNFRTIFSDIKSLLTSPNTFFTDIKANIKPTTFLLKAYLLPIIVVWLIIGLVGSFFFGLDESIFYKFAQILTHIVSFLAWGTISVIILKELCHFMHLDNKIDISTNLIIYSLTPALLANAVASFHYNLDFVWIFSLYSFYLFWIGIKIFFKTTEDKKLILLITTIIVTVLAKLICDMIFSGIFNALTSAQSILPS